MSLRGQGVAGYKGMAVVTSCVLTSPLFFFFLCGCASLNRLVSVDPTTTTTQQTGSDIEATGSTILNLDLLNMSAMQGGSVVALVLTVLVLLLWARGKKERRKAWFDKRNRCRQCGQPLGVVGGEGRPG